MRDIDYSIFSHSELAPGSVGDLEFDIFLSSYNSSDRVQAVFDGVKSPKKIWLEHPEYGYDSEEISEIVVGSLHTAFRGQADESEIDFWFRLFDELELSRNIPEYTLGIDITGMMRSHIIVLPMVLAGMGLKRVSVIYSDPRAYFSGIDTKFTIGSVDKVAQIPGFEGVHSTSTQTREALIIGAGYDDSLIRAAAESKGSADHYVLIGLPSLQPHMYQESKVRVQQASESIHNFRDRSYLYAPANNPFMTAQAISDKVKSLRASVPDLNIYLSPVGAKTQVLGFSWFFLCECRDSATSIIFPYAPSYSRETSVGISRIHIFDFELDWLIG